MQKIKIFTGLIIYGITNLLFASSVSALTPTVSIQSLPMYINITDFKLSCSALGGTNVQFSFKKEGGSYQNLGNVIDVTTSPCQIQVTSSQINEEIKYYFKATLDGVATDETNSIYDNSGPSPVSSYYTDSLGGGDFKIHWRNPNNVDFARVMIYRGDTTDFSADSSHEIATVLGSPDSDMTYGDHVPDQNKTYYYAIRAIDKAGNSSSLVGDGSTSTIIVDEEPSQTGSDSVTQLPREATGGQILGEEVDLETMDDPPAIETPDGIIGKVVKFVKDRTKITVGIIALIISIPVLYFYFLSRRK